MQVRALCKTFSSHVVIFKIYFCQHISQPDQSNNMSADFLSGFPPSKPVKEKKNLRCRFVELGSLHSWERWSLLWRTWISVDHFQPGCLFQGDDPYWIILGEVKLRDGGSWLRMDICRLFLPVCWQQTGVCVCVRGHTPSFVASECCYLSACATFDSKAKPSQLWLNVQFQTFLLPLPPPPTCCCCPVCNVASCLEPVFILEKTLGWFCVFFIYCPIVPSADINRLLKCSRRHKILCVGCAMSLHKTLKRFFLCEIKY